MPWQAGRSFEARCTVLGAELGIDTEHRPPTRVQFDHVGCDRGDRWTQACVRTGLD